MLEQLEPAIEKLLKENPNLRQKSQLNVLMTLGTFHTGFFKLLRKKGTSVSREFSEMPYTFSFFNEAVRRARFGMEVSDELVAKALLEKFLLDRFGWEIWQLTNLSYKTYLFVRILASQFTFDEIKNLFDEWYKYGDQKKSQEFLFLYLDKKGIKFPQSPEEFDKFLEKFKKPSRHASK
jgi:hypothetical protein